MINYHKAKIIDVTPMPWRNAIEISLEFRDRHLRDYLDITIEKEHLHDIWQYLREFDSEQ